MGHIGVSVLGTSHTTLFIMWNLISGLDWKSIATLSKRWANSNELALARQFVDRLEKKGVLRDTESGVVYFEIKASDEANRPLADELRSVLSEAGLLGLNVETTVPARPDGPALACRVSFSEANEVEVAVFVSSTKGVWAHSGKFSVPVAPKLPADLDKPSLTADERLQVRSALLADGIAQGLLTRLVRAQLRKGPLDHGKPTYKIEIDNVSPMILNGLAVTGTDAEAASRQPSMLGGISLPPHKRLTLPATGEVVERLQLSSGVKVVAADLSVL